MYTYSFGWYCSAFIYIVDIACKAFVFSCIQISVITHCPIAIPLNIKNTKLESNMEGIVVFFNKIFSYKVLQNVQKIVIGNLKDINIFMFWMLCEMVPCCIRVIRFVKSTWIVSSEYDYMTSSKTKCLFMLFLQKMSNNWMWWIRSCDWEIHRPPSYLWLSAGW